MDTHRSPPDVVSIDEYDAASGDSGRGAMDHVIDLQQQSHAGREGDALVTGQRQDLIVVHYLHSSRNAHHHQNTRPVKKRLLRI